MLPDSWVVADPALVWGVFTRGLGLIYLIAFAYFPKQFAAEFKKDKSSGKGFFKSVTIKNRYVFTGMQCDR
jgi:hypothetical protein